MPSAARPCRRFRTQAAACALSLTALAPPAAGQADGPVVITRRQEYDWLHLDPIRLSLEFSYRRTESTVETPGQSTSRDDTDLFSEALLLSGYGYVAHPNVAEFDYSLSFQLQQEHGETEPGGFSDRQSDFILEFDIESLILQKTDNPITVFGRRSQSNLDQPFGGSLDITNTQAGIEIDFRSDVLPNRLGYTHIEIDQDARRANGDFGLRQDNINSNGSFRITDRSTLTWDYLYESVTESGDLRETASYDRHNVNVSHEQRMGAQGQHYLRSRFKYTDSQGDDPFTILRLDETLFLRHGPSLTSQYDYAFSEEEFGRSKQRLNRGQGQLRHQLYDSLYTIVTGGASKVEVLADDFESEQYFGGIDFTYDKIVPYGSIRADLGLNYNRRDDSESGGTVQIIDDAQTFNASGFFVIDRRNIVVGSVVITDATGLIIYTENVDYTVQYFGNRIEVQRVPGGLIVPGQTVLVDYQIGPQPGGVTDTFGQSYAFRYDIREGFLRGLGVYVRYLDTDQTRPRGFEAEEADVRELAFGAEYSFEQLYLLAERVEHDSTISPFNRTRLEGRYAWIIGRDSRISFNANYMEIENTDIGTENTTFSAGTRISQRFNDQWNAELDLLYTKQEGDSGSDSEGFEQRLSVNWRYRQTSVYALLRNNNLESGSTDSDFLTFSIGVRRDF